MEHRQSRAKTIETKSAGATRPPPGSVPADTGLQDGSAPDSPLDNDEIELIGDLGNELDDPGSDGPAAPTSRAAAMDNTLRRSPVVSWFTSRLRRSVNFLAARERPCEPWDTKDRAPDAVWIKLFEDEVGAFSTPIRVLPPGALSASPKAPGPAAKPADFAAAKTAQAADFAGRARIAVLSESPNAGRAGRNRKPA